MKTTALQFRILSSAVTQGLSDATIGHAVIANILADLNALQQYEAAGAAQFKAPLVNAYLAEALTQAHDLLALVEQAGGHLKERN